MLFLLIYDNPKKALYEIQTSNSKTAGKDVILYPNNRNIITKDQSQEKLLLEIIERIEELEIKTQCFHKLKTLLPNDKITK